MNAAYTLVKFGEADCAWRRDRHSRPRPRMIFSLNKSLTMKWILDVFTLLIRPWIDFFSASQAIRWYSSLESERTASVPFAKYSRVKVSRYSPRFIRYSFPHHPQFSWRNIRSGGVHFSFRSCCFLRFSNLFFALRSSVFHPGWRSGRFRHD